MAEPLSGPHVVADESGALHVQRFSIAYEYPVYFTRSAFGSRNPVLADALSRRDPGKRHRFLPMVDAGLLTSYPDLPDAVAAYAAAHADRLELIAPAEIVPGGEACKNDPALVERLQRRLYELGVDRHSYTVAIGGGAMLDLAGYVSATAHRGIRHVRMPTTVLAQDDSGVGVKNGFNAFGVKNFLGTFAPPAAVVNDFDLLDMLPARDRIAGMAEAVKVALIRDGAFFAWLEQRADDLAAFVPDAVEYLIRRCAELHMRQIAHGGDPFETGSARPLDYGHWSAHKLEAISGHAVRHGEAVAIGMALDTRYAVLAGMLTPGADERVCRLLRRLGFQLWHPGLAARNEDGVLVLLRGLQDFREHLGGELTITLLRQIGVGEEVHHMDEALILDSLAWLEQRYAKA